MGSDVANPAHDSDSAAPPARRDGRSERLTHSNAPLGVEGQHQASTEELMNALRAYAEQGVERLVLAGGEPLTREDIATLALEARRLGVREFTLVTAGSLLAEPGRAERLRAAGVTMVRVPWWSLDESTHGRFSSGRDSPEGVMRGLRAAAAAGLVVVVTLPVAEGAPSASDRLTELHASIPAIRLFELAVAGSPRGLPGSVLEELERVCALADSAGGEIELSPDLPLPPCVFDGVEPGPSLLKRMRRQLRERAGDPTRAHVACASCALSGRCSVRAERLEQLLGDGAPHPIERVTGYLPELRGRDALRVVDADVEPFFHVDYEFAGESERGISRVGIIYRCNQPCTFCELSKMRTELDPERVRTAIRAARARGSRRLILTGGEPTLCAELASYIALAKQLGFDDVEIQTNAVQLARPGRAARLREAGLDSAQVSLHCAESAISDRLTGAPGTHEKTLAGVEALLRAGVRCTLNHLIFRDNLHLLTAFVELVAERYAPWLERIMLQFHSPRTEFASHADAREHIARYSEYASPLREAIERAQARQLRVADLQDPTGIPSLCIFGADPTYLGPILRQAESARLHAWEREWMTKVEACEDCAASELCMGVPRHYLELYGADEFEAIDAATVARVRRA
ncbi:MAG: radical SAM protein [Deltaproteobacteria bacterium]|nr:radical SAM protein [Deltaproteobacteria bacterium]